MSILVWILCGFFLGSLPFSVWVGKFALKKDIRQEGDHNDLLARAGPCRSLRRRRESCVAVSA